MSLQVVPGKSRHVLGPFNSDCVDLDPDLTWPRLRLVDVLGAEDPRVSELSDHHRFHRRSPAGGLDGHLLLQATSCRT